MKATILKRALALLLALGLIFGICVVPAIAAETETGLSTYYSSAEVDAVLRKRSNK